MTINNNYGNSSYQFSRSINTYTARGTNVANTPTTAATNNTQNPYVLQSGDNWVNWTSGTKPQTISYKDNLYRFAGTENKGSTLRYESVKKLPLGQNNLRISFTGDSKQVVTGYTTERVQVGTQKVQVGTERVQVGTEKVQTGTERYQTGTERVQTGTEKVQTGTERYQTGTERVQTGTEKVQTGTERYQTGTERVQTGTEKVQTGTEQVLSGYKQVQVGTERVQTGTERYQTGTEQVQTGTEKIQTGTRISGHTTRVETGSIDVNRELDGKENVGAVGDILDQGTGLLLDANKANEFFTTAADKYKVSSLTGEDNQANGQNVDIFKKTDADDMYVAGDPIVGGKGNNYKADTITPGTGFITMHEDGVDNGRKVTVNAHVDQINSDGKRAFTEYGFVIQDDSGAKTNATLSGGQLMIDGQPLLPGQQKVIGDPNDPVAKFYYASMPGGENGTNEQRLVFESFEKVTPETRQKLIDAGANPAEVDGLRSKFQSTFGFRIPDGKGSYRSSAGVTGGLSTTDNGVKTYYDAHFAEPGSTKLTTKKEYQDPVYEPVYTEKPIYETRPTYGERPVYTDKPTYEQQPVYTERPVYTDKPTYEDRPTYGERPVYTDKPKYEDRPTYGERPVYTDKPKYEDRPTYGERPVYTDKPKYQDKPVYKEVPIYENKQKPVYGKKYEIKKQLASPLALDLDGDGLKTTPQTKAIDIDGDGVMDQSSWFGEREGVLAFDANKNGKIDQSGLELFGDNSDVNGDGKGDNFANGFEALKSLASNTLGEAAVTDNILDAAEIRALENQAGMRMLLNNQTVKASDHGVSQINLNYQNINHTDAYGNEFRQQSGFQRTLDNGQVVNRDITDVWLNHSPLQQATNRGSVQAATPDWSQQLNMMQSLFNQLLQWFLQGQGRTA
ncbi:MAG: hypothetical protein K0Q50_2675 [Vampirovibrio sp.]|jgi:hypothetical protein|nr:hypothetical protein [Vampirovibrio sp.]